MSVTVVGSVALDTVETSEGKNIEGLGGAATFFSLAAANYVPVHLVGVVGDDFPDAHIQTFASKGIVLDGLERVAGKTFRWTGKYHEDMNNRDTLHTELNVFEHFHPKLPEAARRNKYLFLGNIHPALQMEVFEQTKPQFVALDTMDLWINIALDDLKRVLARVDALIINDSEVKELTGHKNIVTGAAAIQKLGPKIVVIKKGEHGSLLFSDDGIFAAPAMPLRHVADPTGAGDTFAGGFMGCIAKEDSISAATLKRAVIHGTVVASFTCEKFGPNRLIEIGPKDIEQRFAQIRELAAF
jgi:sugar/nucleoside kinase (ribokinase family)